MTQNVREYFRLTGFGWADRAALLVGYLFSFLLLCLWSFAFLVVGKLGAKHLWDYFGIQGVELEILIVGSAWLVMRGADFLAGGPTYRLVSDKSAQTVAGPYTPLGDEPDILAMSRRPLQQSENSIADATRQCFAFSQGTANLVTQQLQAGTLSPVCPAAAGV